MYACVPARTSDNPDNTANTTPYFHFSRLVTMATTEIDYFGVYLANGHAPTWPTIVWGVCVDPVTGWNGKDDSLTSCHENSTPGLFWDLAHGLSAKIERRSGAAVFISEWTVAISHRVSSLLFLVSTCRGVILTFRGLILTFRGVILTFRGVNPLRDQSCETVWQGSQPYHDTCAKH